MILLANKVENRAEQLLGGRGLWGAQGVVASVGEKTKYFLWLIPPNI